MRVPLARFGLALVAATVFASQAWAVNLVTNPSFAGNTTSWSVSASVTFDAANDATGLPGSGSARDTFVAAGSSTGLSLSQCITAGPGNYTLGGKVLIPNGQAVGGAGMVTVSFLSGGNCSVGLLAFDSVSTSTTGSFQTLSKAVVAPAGTTNIWVTGQNSALGAGTHIVNFDDFVLDNGVAPVVSPVPTLDSLGLAALLVTLAAAGLFVMRRNAGR